MSNKSDYLTELAALLEKEEATVLLALEGSAEDIEVEGESANYTVNVVNQTCSCPDFEVIRSKFIKGHLRRICKHLAWPMRNNAAVGSFERMVFQEIKFGLSAVTRFRFISTPDVRIALAVKHDERDWCDIVAPKRKGESHDLYGFNITEQRWSYNTRPKDWQAIEGKILQWAEALVVLKNNS
jgi:acid stress-induced BolA-like protein IbaG/YrbA